MLVDTSLEPSPEVGLQEETVEDEDEEEVVDDVVTLSPHDSLQRWVHRGGFALGSVSWHIGVGPCSSASRSLVTAEHRRSLRQLWNCACPLRECWTAISGPPTLASRGVAKTGRLRAETFSAHSALFVEEFRYLA